MRSILNPSEGWTLARTKSYDPTKHFSGAYFREMSTNTNNSEKSNAHLEIIQGLKVQPEYLFIFGILLIFATGSVLVGITSSNPSVQLLTFAVFFVSLTASISVSIQMSGRKNILGDYCRHSRAKLILNMPMSSAYS